MDTESDAANEHDRLIQLHTLLSCGADHRAERTLAVTEYGIITNGMALLESI